MQHYVCAKLCTPTVADPGFWERGGSINIFTSGGGYGGGVPLPVTARVSGGALIVPQRGLG